MRQRLERLWRFLCRVPELVIVLAGLALTGTVLAIGLALLDRAPG